VNPDLEVTMKRSIACLAAVLWLAAGDLCQAAPALQEGMWETTMETSMEGLPFAIPPTVVKSKQCLTKKDMIPRDENQKDCTVTKQKISGNKASWEFVCNQDGSKMTGRGEVSYTGTTSSGTSTTTMDSEGRQMTAITKFKGKRLGPCTGEADSMEVNGQDVGKMKEQANEALAQKQQLDARMEASRQKSLALIGQVRIPAEKADACEHEGVQASLSDGPAIPAIPEARSRTGCDQRLGPLAIMAGEWEITTESTTKTTYLSEGKTESKAKKKTRAKAKARETEADSTLYSDVTSETRKACLSPDVEPLVGEGMKRSGNTVTWKESSSREAGSVSMRDEKEGGVAYRGDTFEGGVIQRNTSGAAQHTTYTRVTGRRLGDGVCISRGRESSSKKLPGDVPTPSDVIDNSARKLKSLFGF
jgi:hypothetical protein